MITAKRLSFLLLLAFAVNMAFAQAPGISYPSPHTYTVNSAIAPLSPVNSGGGVPGRTLTTLASGLNVAKGIAYDAAGNIYVADANNNAIKKIPAGGGTPVAVGSGFNHPSDVAIDPAGDLYVADSDNNEVKEIMAGSGSTVTLYFVPYGPKALALDSAGNVYVAEFYKGDLLKFAPGNGTPTVVATGFSSPNGVTIDAAGNIYVSDQQNNAIKKIIAGSSMVVTLAQGFGNLTGVAVDAAGNVYFSDTNISSIGEIPAGGNTIVQLAGTFVAVSVTTTPSGILYASDGTNVKKIDNTGYNIKPGLPPGLTFNTNTGVISGTPAATSPATNYTVTATNSSGSSTTTINIAVNNPPAPVISYSGPQVFNVGKAVTPVLPTNSGGVVPGRTVTTLEGGLKVPAGITFDASGNVFVAVSGAGFVREIFAGGGDRVVSAGGMFFTGIAIDGAGNLYVTNNDQSQVAEFNIYNGGAMTFRGGFEKPYALALDATGNLYMADIDKNVIIKIPATGSRTPVVVATGFSRPDGIAVDAAGNIYVSDENNNAIKKVPAGTNTAVTIAQAYGNPTGVAVDAAGNVYFTDTNNPSIAELPAGGGGIVQLSGGLTGPSAIAVTPAGVIYISDGSAVKKIDNWGYNISPGLPAGLTFNTKTGAIAGTPTATSPATNYTITARNPGGVSGTTVNIAIHAGNANLSSIGSSVTPLTPFFAPNTTSYTASVPNTTASMTVKPVTSDPSATVKVNGTTVASGSTSPAIALSVGSNTVNVVVTAPGGLVTKTYTITVNRAQSNNANLTSIGSSVTPLTPFFGPNITSYTASVPYTTGTMTVKPVISQAGATIKVNGTTVASGSTSSPITLAVGANTINVVVTAPDGTTTKTYTITVTRAQSTNANLSTIAPSITPLSPYFAPNTTSYTLSVSNSHSSMTVAPVTSDASATLTVNGTAQASGATSAPIALAVGSNTISIVVTAPNGTTTKTYTITVTRASGGADAYDPGSGLSVNKPEEKPSLEDDILLVHQGVSPNGDGIDDYLVIDGIQAYPDNRLAIMNRNGQLIYEANGYDNSSKVFDGHSNKNGKMQLPGTYFYQLDYTVNGILKHKTGYLLLKY